MKQLFSNSLLLILFFGVVSCSCCNSRGENTALGAVAGGVLGGLAGSTIGAGTGQAVAIGAGAIAGALVGGAVGHNWDSTDNTRAYRVMDFNPTNKGQTWKNKKTKASYTITPTTGMVMIKGNPNCRKFTTSGVIDGKNAEAVNAVACRQADGTWKTIS